MITKTFVVCYSKQNKLKFQQQLSSELLGGQDGETTLRCGFKRFFYVKNFQFGDTERFSKLSKDVQFDSIRLKWKAKWEHLS